MARSIAGKTSRPRTRPRVETLALPTANPRHGGRKVSSHALQTTALTIMSACAGFAVVAVLLPHAGF